MNDFQSNFFKKKDTIVSLVFIGIYYVCLLPYSININGTGITANYFYIFLPLILLIPGLERRLIYRREIALIIIVLTIIYLVSIFLEFFESSQFSLRRFFSFGVFILPLSLAFIKFEKKDLYSLKMAILLICIYYSLHKVLLFSTLTLGFDWYFNFVSTPDSLNQFWGKSLRDIHAINLKGIVGSQRYGFLLMFGLFISIFESKLFFYKAGIFLRFTLSSFLFFSCLLTFSRATFISLIIVGLYCLYRNFFQKRLKSEISKDSTRLKILLFALLFGVLIFIFGIFYYFGDSGFLAYYKSRFIQPFMVGSESFWTNPNSSEGYRLMLFSKVIEYVSLHPFTGSGYQGLYLLYDEFLGVGSVHNQYLDVLLRVGLIGASLWLFLVYRVLQFCRSDPALFYGFIAILLFGIFHETFKISYGSFIFGMLLSFSYCTFPINNK